MKIEHLKMKMHIDLDEERYIELRLDIGKDGVGRAFDEGVCESELWMVDTALNDRGMRNYDLFMNENITWDGMLEDNLYRILKTYRKEGLPLERLEGFAYLKEYRWLYYKKEFYGVLPVLMQWGHAYAFIEVNGVASNNIPFSYSDKRPKHTLTDQADSDHENAGNCLLHIGEHTDCTYFMAARGEDGSGSKIKEVFRDMDRFIIETCEVHQAAGRKI